MKHLFEASGGEEPRAYDPDFTEWPDYTPASVVEWEDHGSRAIYQGINTFAGEWGGYCNGPRCVRCGESRCVHGHGEDSPDAIYLEDCPG